MCVKDGGLFGEQDCCVIASTVCVCEALHDVQQAVTGGGEVSAFGTPPTLLPLACGDFLFCGYLALEHVDRLRLVEKNKGEESKPVHNLPYQ